MGEEIALQPEVPMAPTTVSLVDPGSREERVLQAPSGGPEEWRKLGRGKGEVGEKLQVCVLLRTYRCPQTFPRGYIYFGPGKFQPLA